MRGACTIRSKTLVLAALIMAASVVACKRDVAVFLRNPPPRDITAVLDNSTQFVLLSVDPLPGWFEEEATSPKDVFYDHAIIGKIVLQGKRQRTALLRALYQGISESDGKTIHTCFNPRHGIHATDGKATVDLLICFECWQIYTYTDHGHNMITITDSPKKAFDEALRAAGIPVSVLK